MGRPASSFDVSRLLTASNYSNMIVQYTGKPSIFLPVCMAIWGVSESLSQRVPQRTS